MPEGCDLAIQPVASRSRLIAEVQFAIATAQLADQPLNRTRRVRHLAEKPYLTSTPAIGNRNRVLGLRDIERDKGFAILPMARPPCTRLGSAYPSNPRLLFCTNGLAVGLSPGT